MSTILFEIRGNIALLSLNRPDKFNAFNREMSLALQERLDVIEANKAIRAVHLTGSGKAFSAGQDLAELTGAQPFPVERILSEHFNPIVSRLRKLPKPVVCAINGVAAGAGVNIALACDVVVAAASATFIQAFSKIGLIPDSGGTFTLPRLIGLQKASALMMLGEKITAAEAERLGMIYQVIDDAQLPEVSLKLAGQLAEMPTQGLAYTKQALNASWSNNFEQQLQLEDRLQAASANTADFREGIQAFLEKRPAVFKGV